MESHSEINGLSPATLRFLFDGCRIHYDDTPDFVSLKYLYLLYSICLQIYFFLQLEMEDDDIIDYVPERIGFFLKCNNINIK